jgi:hypothetical protein
MTDLTDFQNVSPRDGHIPSRPIFQRPDEVFADPEMSRAEKRALLASWASDARAVPGLPSMRQLEDGSLIDLDEILQALKALDAASNPGPLTTTTRGRRSAQRRSRPWLRNWGHIMRHRRRDDDDDPPPSAVLAAVPPKAGGGGAFAYPETALA